MFQYIDSIFDELRRRHCFLVTAESLTGGLIAQHITEIAGASAVFWGGWITYSAQAKQRMLNVAPIILEQHGVISIETAAAMAQGALAIASAESGTSCYAVAVTGLAGPSGGTPEIPVGTVCIACAGNEREAVLCSEKFLFRGTRASIREQTYTAAMQLLQIQLEKTRASQSS